MLKDLKSRGYKLAACSNSNIPSKRREVFHHLGYDVDEIFDCFVVSGDCGIRKPDPAILNLIVEKLYGPDEKIKPYEICSIGDSIAKDVLSSNLAGMRSVHFVYAPVNKA